MEGGCLCGAVRFVARSIFDCLYCHCSQCRKMSGGPFTMVAVVEAEKFSLIQGEPASFRRSNGRHHFCGQCGSPLFYRGETGEYVSVPVGAFDEPEQIRPLAHQCWRDRLAWVDLRDGLPHFPGTEVSHPDKRRL